MMIRRTIGRAALAGVVLMISSAAHAAIGVGDTPSFQVQGIDSKPLSLEQYKGKIVIVDFWATWCGPCMAEAQHMVDLNNEYGPKGVQLIGISLDEDEAALRSIVKSKGFAWPQFFDGNGWKNQLAVEWGVQSIPATFILDPEGKVVWKGHPANIDRALADAMTRTPPSAINPALARETVAKLDEIEKLLADAPEKALNILASVAPESMKDLDLKARIEKARAGLEAFSKGLVDEAQALVKEKKFEDAASKLESVIPAMASTDVGALARQTLDSISALPEYIAQKEAAAKAKAEADKLAKANDELKAAQVLQGKKRHEDAYAAYKAIAKSYPGTDAAKAAADAVATYEKDVAFIRKLNDKAAAERAEPMLSLARNYAKAGNADTARRKYKEIMNQFPNTTYFDTAKKESAELDVKKKK